MNLSFLNSAWLWVLSLSIVLLPTSANAQLGSTYDPNAGQDSGLFYELESTEPQISALQIVINPGCYDAEQQAWSSALQFEYASATPENFAYIVNLLPDIQEEWGNSGECLSSEPLVFVGLGHTENYSDTARTAMIAAIGAQGYYELTYGSIFLDITGFEKEPMQVNFALEALQKLEDSRFETLY